MIRSSSFSKGKYLIVQLLFTLLLSQFVFAQRGKDGVFPGSATINIYTPLAIDALAGANSVTVNNATGIGTGDLIMIIQMQGVSINSIANNINWGSVTSYNGCGSYEIAEITSVTGNVLSFCNAYTLKNNYQAAGNAQIVRIPRYTSLTVTGTLSAQPWNGNTGGVIAAEVSGNITVTGQIDVSGLGFRGGSLINDNNSSPATPPTALLASPDGNDGSEKGEGVFGYQAAYDALNPVGGRYCRGAAGNAGGGGDQHNAGGGGGGNAGDIAIWNGKGNPDNTDVNWAAAWNLESPGFANNISSGGGRGGYTWAGNVQNPFTVPPGDPSWGGQNRWNVGGFGGRPLDYSTGKIFMGGGGGAGDQNNGFGGDGGAGGGIVYLTVCGDVSGSGKILANGANGKDNTGDAIDAPGGAGAGGAIIINAGGTINISTISADGGVGGNQVFPAANNTADSAPETEGPGGGGGGGYVSITNPATVTPTVRGGANGITNRWFLNYNISPDAAHPVYPFPPNGATKGGDGIIATPAIAPLPTVNSPTICSGETAGLAASTDVDWYDAPEGGNLVQGFSKTYTTLPLTATTTFYIDICPRLCKNKRIPAVVTVIEVPVLKVIDPAPVCAPLAVNITASPGVWEDTNTGISGTGITTYWSDATTSTPLTNAETIAVSGKYYIKRENGLCMDTALVNVVINPGPDLKVIDPVPVCAPATVDITLSPTVWEDIFPGTNGAGTTSYWSDPATSVSLANPDFIAISGTYYIKKENGTCIDTAVVRVTVNSVPVLKVTDPAPVCAPLTVNITLSPAVWEDTNLATKSTGTTSYWSDATTTTTLTNAETIAASGMYYIKKENGICTDTAVVKVSINPAPNLKVINPAPVCAPATVDITLSPEVWEDTNISTGGAGTTTYWSNATTSAAIPDPSFIPVSGTYYIRKVNDACSDTAVVHVKVTYIDSQISDSVLICKGESATLSVNGGDKYMWSTEETTSFINVTPAATTTYRVLVFREGCVENDSVKVIVKNENPNIFYIPNAFTPNEDDVNDIFKVIPNEKLLEFHGMIFNRWGELYYEWKDETKGWDGKLDDRVVQEDVYIYRISSKTECKSNKGRPLVGTVTVVR